MSNKETKIQVALGLKVPEGAILERVDTGMRFGAKYIHRKGEWYWTSSIGGGDWAKEDPDPVDENARKFLNSLYLGRCSNNLFHKKAKESK